jgi:hypothetical protein
MDFITSLPKSKGKNVIMVVVDQIKNYAHFFSLSHPFEQSTLATYFMEIVQKRHGIPKIIVSDKDPFFTINFCTELFYCFKTRLPHSSSYHPQSNGQTHIVKNVYKGIFIYFHLINRHNGSSDFPWKNGGTTRPYIIHQNCHHLWHFMDIFHASHHP